MTKTTPAIDRFMAKVDQNGPIPPRRPDLGPCWIWTASVRPNGYGQFGIGSLPLGTRTVVGAHRWIWQHLHGPLPPGHEMEVDHLCSVRRCVNPTHLEAVPAAENNRRSGSPECKWGHALSGSNLYIPPDHPTWRKCRECGRRRCRETSRRRRERARAARTS